MDGIPFESWRRDHQERREWDVGKVDARACVHCATLTYAHHTPLVMQTSFKTPLPPDPTRDACRGPGSESYRGHGLLAARRRRDLQGALRSANTQAPGASSPMQHGQQGRQLRADGPIPEELHTKRPLPETVTGARELFGPDNVRYFGAGVPEVLLNGGVAVAADTAERLLTWAPR